MSKYMDDPEQPARLLSRLRVLQSFAMSQENPYPDPSELQQMQSAAAAPEPKPREKPI